MATNECHCLICVDGDPGRDADLVETVGAHGWSVLWVAGGVDFAYTIGLWHTFRRPELVMFGLDGPGMQHWLNAAVGHGRASGWPEPDQPFRGVVDGFATLLRPVHDSWYDPLFGTADRFYRGGPVPAQQLVWPDRTGRWPWDEQATVTCRTRQAFGWLPVDEHPAGSWRLVGELEPGFAFPVGPDEPVLTTRRVAEGASPVARVCCDDGSYDVLDERGHAADDLCLVLLGYLVRRHPLLLGCAELGDGQVATAAAGQTWTVLPLGRDDRDASRREWQRATPL